jgi:hypothetical protein
LWDGLFFIFIWGVSKMDLTDIYGGLTNKMWKVTDKKEGVTDKMIVLTDIS